jgi:hypothetical protein
MAGLDWNREVNRERMVLERIVALLLALAGLADRAANASSRRRRQALEFLAIAETEARNMVAGLAGLPCAPDDGVPPQAAACASADDARRLAAAHRLLALALLAMLEEARCAAAQLSPIFRASMKAACGMSTLPNWRMRFLPSFCFSSSLRLRVTSPP